MRKNERISTSPLRMILKLFIFLIVVSIQVAFYYFLFWGIYAVKLCLFIISIIGLLSVFYIYGINQNSSYKLSWTIFILLMPVAGTIIYLMVGNGKIIPKRKVKKIGEYLNEFNNQSSIIDDLKQSNPEGYKFAKLVNSLSKMPAYKNTKCVYFDDAVPMMQALINDIRKAKRYIFMEYFIVASGELMDNLIDELCAKAQEGVEVRFVYDAIGSNFVLKKRTLARFGAYSNIFVREFNPMGFSINPAANYRDHRKITVIDGEISYTGGNNLADEYVHKKVKYGKWRDNAIRLEGDAVNGFLYLFCECWFMTTMEKLNFNEYRSKKVNQIQSESIHLPFGDGPTNKKDPAYNLITSMFENAKKYIYISTPYFIIDKEFISNICRSAQSGVEVKMLIPHIPDKKTVFMLTKSHLYDLLLAGVEVYEYTPGFNHAKTYITDDNYAFIGTVNLDYRSLFLHFECGDFMIGDPVIAEIKNDFLNAVSVSQKIDFEKYKKRNLFIRIRTTFLNVLSPLL